MIIFVCELQIYEKMIGEQLSALGQSIPPGVALVAVSKFQPVEAIRQAYDAGQRLFGESRPQELAAKYQALPRDIEWHFIGHLQTNKVKLIAPFVSLIHSVDSQHLAQAINTQAARCGRVIDVLLQLRIALEQTKQGWDATQLLQTLETGVLQALPHIRIRGLMGMATFTEDTEQVGREFRALRQVFLATGQQYLPGADILSMGISADYPIAIAHGSTMVRIGSQIFGQRGI